MKSVACIVLGWLLLLTATSAADGNYNRGIDAYNKAEYLNAYNLLLPAAEHVNTNAQFRIGYLLLNGLGVQKDTKQGLAWLRKSAESGDYVAQSYLGEIFLKENGVKKNLVEAYAWKDVSNRNYRHVISASELDEIKSQMTPEQLKEAGLLADSYYEKYVKPFKK